MRVKKTVQDVVTNWAAMVEHCDTLTHEELAEQCDNIPDNRGDYSRESWDAMAA